MSAFEKYIYEFGNFESKFGSIMSSDYGTIDMRSNKATNVITMTDKEIRKEKRLETDGSLIFQLVLWKSLDKVN